MVFNVGIIDPFGKRMDAPDRTQALQNLVHKLRSHHTQHGPSGPVGLESLCLETSPTTVIILSFALKKGTKQKVQNQLGEAKQAVDKIRLTWGVAVLRILNTYVPLHASWDQCRSPEAGLLSSVRSPARRPLPGSCLGTNTECWESHSSGETHT